MPQCQDWLISRAFLVIFVFTAESGDGKAGIMPPCPDYQTHRPHSHKVIIFFLQKPELKYYYPVIKTAGLYPLLLPSTSHPENILSGMVPCRLIQPYWSLHPGRSHPPCQSCSGTPAFAEFFSLGWRGLANPPLFQGARGHCWGGYPSFTWHLCKVKPPERGNL